MHEQRLYGLLWANGFITITNDPTPEQMEFISRFCVGDDLIFNSKEKTPAGAIDTNGRQPSTVRRPMEQ